MDCKLEKGKLHIILDANTENPPVSGPGKTLLVATASQPTNISVKGKALRVCINATIPNPEYKPEKTNGKSRAA